ncbi:pentatricopeptide repeat-containing protein At2g03880, mitochondrial-like [Typha angustifolia]|uniref:pentatricopeptide repeat-containing protein At2g03880, mitochondrial-like n=1 Tax=Typha angustifolia TaxID=59011 RepID=UPI003C2C19A0
MVLLNCYSLHVTANPPPAVISNTKPIKATAAVDISGDLKVVSANQSLRNAIAIKPSSYGPFLQACAKEKFLEGGLQVHAHIVKRGFQSDQFLLTNLLNLYMRCGSLESACKVFDIGPTRTNLVSWNSIITMYCQYGLVEEALLKFLELQQYGFLPDQFTFSVAIRAVECRKELFLGSQLHSLSIKLGYQEEEFVGNSLIQMYDACGRINDSICVFEKISKTRNPVTWNLMITRLVEREFHGYALQLYEQMRGFEVGPTAPTFSILLKSSTNSESISLGRQIHSQVIIHGFSTNMILETALVDMYVKCGELEKGRLVFDRMNQRSVITWNSIIRGYCQMGCREESWKLYRAMRREEIAPDKYTFPALLSGISREDYSSEELKIIHAHIIRTGLETDPFVGVSLITMYSAKENFADAKLVFHDADHRDIAMWSSMISACANCDVGEEALQLFIDMLHLDVEPNKFIYSNLFVVCGDLCMLDIGRQIHAHSFKSNTASDAAMKNSLLTMYSNCGCIEEAWSVFNSTEDLNVISFNSMIAALAQHGSAQKAVELFRHMKHIGLSPDGITLVNVLSAFNHAGLVHEGLELFNSMEENEGIEPVYQHYACIVDMLARSGEINKAITIISNMPFKPDSSLWRILLGACSKHRDIDTGRQIAEMLLEMEPRESTNYILYANIYARLGRWVEAEKVRGLMEERGIEKEVAISWIEVNRTRHTFGVEDHSHPLSEDIYKNLRKLIREIKVVGYVPDVSFTTHNMEEREESLYYHCEKLAFAFGDLATAPGITLRVMKNLRVCGDCHCAYKHFSLITGREIILRDRHRFHHFIDGVCSCGDYW